MGVCCHDCGAPYGAADWIEAVIPHEIWRQISPTGDEGGILCIGCMAKRLVGLGMDDVPVKLTAGPFRLVER